MKPRATRSGSVFAGAAIFLVAGPALAQSVSNIADLCRGRSPCTLVAAKVAGKDAQGRSLTVVEINLGQKPRENSADRFDCDPYRREFWVRTEGVAAAQRVFELCNDGYGAAGVGEDEVEIGDNRLVHKRNGGSAWRWDVARTVQLSPLRVLTEGHCSYHNIAPGFTTTQWDWRRLAGETRWTPKKCARATDDDEMGCTPEKATRRFLNIPMLGGALERAGGKRLHLGSCAALIDESGQRGFVLFGRPRAGGAELRALLISNRDLIVSVTDDKFAAGVANWVNSDHVELWLGHGRTNLECENEKPANLRQWGIGLDGKVHAGHGNPRTAPRVIARLERKVGARTQVTLHLFLPEDVDGLTLAYSKSAGGKQERLVASSPVRRTDATTLGAIWRVEPKAVVCAERNGALDLTDTGLPVILEDQ
jgi:hypothetical protein